MSTRSSFSNAGSSSIEFSLFIELERGLARDLRGQIEGLYTASKFQGKGADGAPRSETSSGENSAPVRERVLHAADWIGVRVDNEQNRKHGPRSSATQRHAEPRLRVGDSDERRADDCAMRAPVSRLCEARTTAPGNR